MRREGGFATLGVFVPLPGGKSVGQLVFAAHLGRAFGLIGQLPDHLQFELAPKRSSWHDIPRLLACDVNLEQRRMSPRQAARSV